MTEYHKIETLFERDAATFVVDPARLKASVLGTIREWDVTEKIDGTNIRVMLSEAGHVSFGGRTDAAQIPADLVRYLIQTFQQDRLKEVLWLDPEAPASVILYGEGYGPGIQKGGGLYRADKAFILFDVLVTTMVRDIKRPCPVHPVPQSVTQSGPTSGADSVKPATIANGSRSIQRLLPGSENMVPNIGQKTEARSDRPALSTEQLSMENSECERPSAVVISEQSTASPQRNTTVSQINKEESAPSAESRNAPRAEAETPSRLPLITATKADECGASCAPPVMSESTRQNLLKAGWTPPSCTCTEQQWWLDRGAVEDIAAKLGIDSVPYLGRMTLDEIVLLVREPFSSKLGAAIAEGVVARPIETLFDKRLKRIIIKLKTKDFVAGKR